MTTLKADVQAAVVKAEAIGAGLAVINPLNVAIDMIDSTVQQLDNQIAAATPPPTPEVQELIDKRNALA